MLGASNVSVEICTNSVEDGSGVIAAQKGREYWGKSPCGIEQRQGATSSVCPKNRANYLISDSYAFSNLLTNHLLL